MHLPYLILFLALTAVLAIVWAAAWLMRKLDETYQSGFDHGFLEGRKAAVMQTQLDKRWVSARFRV